MHRLPLFIAMLCLAACNSQPETPQGAFTTDEYHFEPGLTINLTYDATDSSARFTHDEPMFLTVYAHRGINVRWYRFPMMKQGGLYSATYRIPDSAYHIAFYASPEGTLDNAHAISGRVFHDEIGTSSNVYGDIAYAPAFWLSEKYYRENAEDEPQSTARYAGMWHALGYPGRDATPYYPVLDSLYEHTVAPALVREIHFTADHWYAALVCLCADLRRGLFERASTTARACARQSGKGRFQGSLRLLVHDVWSAIARSADFVSMGNDAELRARVIADIVDMVIRTESSEACINLMYLGSPNAIVDGSMHTDVYDEVRTRQNLERIARIVSKTESEVLMNEMWGLREIQLGLLHNSDAATALTFSERVLPAVDTAQVWIRSDNTLPVAMDNQQVHAEAFHATLDSLRMAMASVD